jgi:two-component system OmpR family sensor kinase
MLGTLFQPFIQGGDGKGFGLGLAIAKRAIKAHGGDLTARNKFPNGLVVAASLPAARTDSQFSSR